MAFAGSVQSSQRDLARRLAAEGNDTAARDAFRKALNAAPRDVLLLLEAGIFEAERGETAVARRYMEKALKIAPGHPDVHGNLGWLYRQVGALALAERHFRKAVDAAPGDANLLYGLGDVLAAQDKHRDGLVYLLRASELQDDDAEIFNALGNSWFGMKRVAEAIECYRKAVALNPQFERARANYANALRESGDTPGALATFAAIGDLSQLPTEMRADWAAYLQQHGRYEDAKAVAVSVLESHSGHAGARIIRANLAIRDGDFERAETDFRLALAADPAQGAAYHGLATIERLTDADEAALRALMGDPKADDDCKAFAGFALYKLLSSKEAHESAFEALAEANRLRAEVMPFDIAKHQAYVESIIAGFGKGFLEERGGEGLNKSGPVFIVGMPRSGTTLVEQILAAHPDVHAGGERNDVTDIVTTLRNYPDQLALVGPSWAGETAQGLFDRMFAGAGPAKFATDKLPPNYLHLGLITWLFPAARIVYCKRDPMDVGLSCFEQYFGEGSRFSYDLRACGAVYGLHEKIMRHWVEILPSRPFDVCYEDLVHDPERNTRALLDYVGLNWDARCLAPQDVNRPIETASAWQARQSITTGSIGRWKRFERQLAPMVEAMEEYSR